MERSHSESAVTLAESAADVTAPEPTGYAFGPFVVDIPGLRLLRDGEPVQVSPRVFQTLLVLVRHRDRVVTKDELISTVWHGTFVSDDSLVQNISILRRVLGDEAGAPKYVATAAKRGYRFIDAGVQVLWEGQQPQSASIAAVEQVIIPAAPQSRLRMHLAYALTAVAALVVGAITVNMIRVDARTTAADRQLFTVEVPPGTTLVSGGTLSPEGRYLAFVARNLEGTPATRVWIREMESGATRALPGTDDASNPFWSPSGSDVAFFAGNRLKRVGLADGLVRVLAETTHARPQGGSWSVEDEIIFSDSGSLFTVPASGGETRLLKAPRSSASEYSLTWPQFLPDGRHYLYRVVTAETSRTGTYFTAVGSEDAAFVLADSGPGVSFAAPDRLVFIRDGVVMAQQFDSRSGVVRGKAMPVNTTRIAKTSVSTAIDGLLTFGGGAEVQTAWVDRDGAVLARVEPPSLLNPSLGTNGNWLVGSRPDGVWHVDLERNTRTRLVPNGSMPFWARAGDKFLYAIHRGEQNDIYLHSMRGDDPDRLLLRTPEQTWVMDWSADEQYVLYVSWNARTHHDLWVLPASGNGKPRPYLTTPVNETQGAISPDGRWVAYASDESGRWEVYLDRFPSTGSKLAISDGGGAQPHWRKDGKELFYLRPDGTMMAVDVRLESMPQVGVSRPLFQVALPGGLVDVRNHYEVSGDGKRFLVQMLNVTAPPEPIRILTNWNATPARPAADTQRYSQ